MKNYADVYLNPEQVAEKLQLAVETVYRWLRAGKIRGSRISPKAWRVSERELASFMKRQNVSELLFEEYVGEHELGPADHEPPFPGTTKRVDYRLVHKGQRLWFEVKEFADDPRLFVDGVGGAYDPYVNIRAKIGKAAEKFRDYDGECCSLVLFNERTNLAEICEPSIVLGAMLGAVAFRTLINLETGTEVGPTTNTFTDGGRLVHPYIKTPQNTTISAVIALNRFAVGQKEFRIKVEQKEIAEQRCLSWQEDFELMEANRAAYDRSVLRTIVYENPHAKKPLPRDIFTGPFDQRWGQSGDVIAPVYTGAGLARLREVEHELELDANPFKRHLRRKARNQGAVRARA
jgi:excisionase family DNA binding protein